MSNTICLIGNVTLNFILKFITCLQLRNFLCMNILFFTIFALGKIITFFTDYTRFMVCPSYDIKYQSRDYAIIEFGKTLKFFEKESYVIHRVHLDILFLFSGMATYLTPYKRGTEGRKQGAALKEAAWQDSQYQTFLNWVNFILQTAQAKGKTFGDVNLNELLPLIILPNP